MLVDADLPEWALEAPEALLPTTGAVRFLNQAARREGIEGFGLLAGQEGHVDALGTLGRILCASPTLGDALRAQMDNHRAFSSHGRIWVRPWNGELQLCQSFSTGFDESWRQADHYLVMLLIGLLRLAAGASWCPSHAQFQTGEHRSVRDAPALAHSTIAFAQPVSAVTFPRALLHAPLHPPGPADALPPATLLAWRRTAPADDHAGAVGQIVETLSRERYPRVADTARVMGCSTRTLQRHLAHSGSSHETLVERSRLATAARLLTDTDARILDVALDVGYSDHAHFTRAFRRWTGVTPTRYRREHRPVEPLRAVGERP